MLTPKIFRRFIMFSSLVFCLLATAATAQENIESPARYFPDTTAIYLEVGQPAEVIEKLEQHALIPKIAELPQFKQALRSPEFAVAVLGKTLVESQLGTSLLESIKSNVSRGLAIGIDAKTEGVAMVFQTSDEAKLKRLAGTLLNVAANGAQREGKPIPFKKGTYRDCVTAEFDDFIVARYKTWFIVANKQALSRAIADNLIDGPKKSLAAADWFVAANAHRLAADATLHCDLNTIRNRGLAPQLFRGESDNPGMELVFGGFYDALKHAPHATATLQLNESFELQLQLPFETTWANPARHFFYGPQLQGTAPQPLLPKNCVTSLVAYRDVADWWLSKEDLFTEAVIAQLAQTDSQFSTIFSGMDFGEDVLGALQPGVQIVVAEQDFNPKYSPDIRLPAFAFVGKMKQPQEIQRRLKVAFQSVVGFANLGLGMNGQPQLDLDTETIGNAKISSSQYLVDEHTEQGLLLFNFSPSVAFTGEYLIVSSDRELAIELAELAAERNKNQTDSIPTEQTKQDNRTTRDISEPPINTRMKIDSRVLLRVLEENREPLIANNMIEEGHGRKAAEQEIDMLLILVGLIGNGKIELDVQPNQLQMNLELQF